MSGIVLPPEAPSTFRSSGTSRQPATLKPRAAQTDSAKTWARWVPRGSCRSRKKTPTAIRAGSTLGHPCSA